MRWSKLKQIVESRFAPSVAGRVRLMVTRYRRAHDQEGRWAIVVDKEEIAGFDTISTFKEDFTLTSTIAEREELAAAQAHRLAVADRHARAHHTMEAFIDSLQSFIGLSIEDCMASDDAVVRAMGILDARLGKRRLAELSVDYFSTELERACLRVRLEAEGLPRDKTARAN